jgi:hypothetical protein
MTCPEFSVTQDGKFIFVASHCVETDEALQLSIAFNHARIEHARKDLPSNLRDCVLCYDLRGQRYPETTPTAIRHALESLCELRFMTE